VARPRTLLIRNHFSQCVIASQRRLDLHFDIRRLSTNNLAQGFRSANETKHGSKHNRPKAPHTRTPKPNLAPNKNPGGVASVTVDVENVVLPGILSRYSSLAARWSDTPPYTDKP
jgi:hypothetical protein